MGARKRANSNRTHDAAHRTVSSVTRQRPSYGAISNALAPGRTDIQNGHSPGVAFPPWATCSISRSRITIIFRNVARRVLLALKRVRASPERLVDWAERITPRGPYGHCRQLIDFTVPPSAVSRSQDGAGLLHSTIGPRRSTRLMEPFWMTERRRHSDVRRLIPSPGERGRPPGALTALRTSAFFRYWR